jgi:hypothetical protein
VTGSGAPHPAGARMCRESTTGFAEHIVSKRAASVTAGMPASNAGLARIPQYPVQSGETE